MANKVAAPVDQATIEILDEGMRISTPDIGTFGFAMGEANGSGGERRGDGAEIAMMGLARYPIVREDLTLEAALSAFETKQVIRAGTNESSSILNKAGPSR